MAPRYAAAILWLPRTPRKARGNICTARLRAPFGTVIEDFHHRQHRDHRGCAAENFPGGPKKTGEVRPYVQAIFDMSKTLGNYSFLPWLRLGLANEIVSGASDDGRAVINVKLALEGVAVSGGGTVAPPPVEHKVALFGPGDIQGVERRAVVRTEPRDWSTNFESNYLPAIEFYDEDFPWRYTPAAPDDKGRLLPWLALLVLEEKEISPEFTDGKDMTGKPLPYIQVANRDVFPDPAQMWAWAHVHANRSLASPAGEIVSTDMGQVLPKLQGVLAENADLALSRVLSPRKLEANKAYHAFLIPAFESGRRTGLGLPHDGSIPPTTSAWAGTGALDVPYYYRWFFHTSARGDFESLVRLLKPRPADHRVGRRDIDVQHPGMKIRGVRSELGGILKLGGALQVPLDPEVLTPEQLAELKKYDEWAKPYPQDIQKDIAAVVNLADDYAELAVEEANRKRGIFDPEKPTEGDPDPVVTPPLYGMWHALAKRVLTERSGAPIAPNDNWLHELNLDPRWRVAAGFGTRVVQDQQEKYMDAAWQQIGAVLEGNRRIRLGQAACGVSTAWFDGEVKKLKDENQQKGLQLAGPVNARMTFAGETIHSYYTGTLVPPTMTCGGLRRVMRPRGRLARGLPFNVDGKVSDVFRLLNEGRISPAPTREPNVPKQKPVDLTIIERVIDNQLHPDVTIPKRVQSAVRLPERIKQEIRRPGDNGFAGDAGLAGFIFVGDSFVEAMVYPQFDTPMYEPLKNISSELFLPNVELIPDNSITLLEPNRQFIEAYMAGLNHEFARELLWREYPTDQRGSYFRQFWGVSSTFNDRGDPDDPAWKNQLRDITALDRWDKASKLGSHKTRSASNELVLVIRGEVLKRYPTAVVYAHHAMWQPKSKSDPTPDRSKPRLLEPLTDLEEARPPREKVLTPMYEAKIDPDIYCFGFDLSLEKARGTDAEPGWYFVLKERPGEPRFGLDIDRADDLEVWNDLSWADMPRGAFLKIDNLSRGLRPVPPPVPTVKTDQRAEDDKIAWSADMTAADLAYILFQTPVLVGVHASEMLPPKKP
jgi:hypothetical protein